MKIWYFLLLSGFTGLLAVSCDKLEAPYADIQKIHVDTSNHRNILLEDYTGHRCVNCPEASLTAQTLMKQYSPRLIVMAVHAGFYASPLPPDFPADYRTAEGTAWFNDFDLQLNPIGMIDRKPFNGKQGIPAANWADTIAKEMNIKQQASIKIFHQLNLSRVADLSLEISVKFREQLTGSYNLSVCILEDSIIGPQSNNNPNVGPTPVIPDYVFMDMLRAVVNGTYGDQITASVDTTQTYTWNKTNYPLDTSWTPKHCSVVAFVFNSSTSEIIQAEKKQLIDQR